MYEILLRSHSGLSWVVLALVLGAIVKSVIGMSEAMKDSVMRFWLVEHLFGMLIGITLITIGRITSKKGTEDKAKLKKIAVYSTLGLFAIIITIPWPFREALGRGWF
ncbi:MAG: hypothetical protein ACJATS_000811 [Psychroserpens sp.]|jgi:hypothetical protein